MSATVAADRAFPAAVAGRWAAMRTALPILCVFLCGCGAKPVSKEIITDSTGSNQLARIDRDVSSIMDTLQSRQSFDFDSIVWRTNASGIWHDHIVISSAAFQAGSPRRRWVSQIHSLDAAKGTAIIKVAEGDLPEGSPSVRYIYSWREWSLLTNGEVRLIRTCADPFEKY
jgi:hypothetical protein